MFMDKKRKYLLLPLLCEELREMSTGVKDGEKGKEQKGGLLSVCMNAEFNVGCFFAQRM